MTRRVGLWVAVATVGNVIMALGWYEARNFWIGQAGNFIALGGMFLAGTYLKGRGR